jgi:hypothetical protein
MICYVGNAANSNFFVEIGRKFMISVVCGIALALQLETAQVFDTDQPVKSFHGF